MDIKIGIKGRILKGKYAPNGEIIVEKSGKNFIDYQISYYIYMWPNDGTKWLGTDEDMVYDTWLQDWSRVERYFKNHEWEIEWYDSQLNFLRALEGTEESSASPTDSEKLDGFRKA